MLPNVKQTTIAALAALSIALIPATPAAAWGQREQDVLKGVVGAVIVQNLIRDANRHRQTPPIYQEPQPLPRYGNQHRRHHDEDRYTPRQHTTSIYHTPAAQAFNSYSRTERRLIQQRLSRWGYYRGAHDGSFGPGTYSAIAAYARDEGHARDLASIAGAYGVYDSLIY